MQVTLVSDIQGAEFPVFSHLADTTLAKRIDTVCCDLDLACPLQDGFVHLLPPPSKQLRICKSSAP